jgi:phosphatidylserine/phosphatidylglycerophosphate/cardiolipin synthase-like enzyme
VDQATWDSLTQYKVWGSFDGEYPAASRSFFSPYDKVHEVIMAVVKSAKTSLHVAMYGWDDADVNDAILEAAKNAAIRVKVALDSSQAAGKGETPLLKLWPQSDYLNSLVIGQSSKHAISHDKIIVADDCLITGSTNLSTSGQTLQNNQATVEWNSRKAVEGINVVERIFAEMAANPNVEGYRHLVGGA